MYKILIAGAGQLGSRHLQGVKTSVFNLDIWVYDLSESALEVAKERYGQVKSENEKRVHFVTSLEAVPEEIDVAIVASSSKPRCSIVKQLLADHNVRYMILEKFLFPRLSEYEEISALLDKKRVETWVNCPRRMWDEYTYIKSKINHSEPILFSYEGSQWGMCCNTIHFVDIFMFLCGEATFNVSIDGLLPEIIDSKRSGYVEVSGVELFSTPSGNILKLVSSLVSDTPPHVVIRNGENIFEYYETVGEMYENGVLKKGNVYYQSDMTGRIIDSVLADGTCRLTPYMTSMYYHIEYLEKIAPFIRKYGQITSDLCPIT